MAANEPVDGFNARIMQGLIWRLVRSTCWRLGSTVLREVGHHRITLRVLATATRYNELQQQREALVMYYPPNVLEDEWVPVKDVKSFKTVEIAQLSAHTKVLLYEQFCASYKLPPTRLCPRFPYTIPSTRGIKKAVPLRVMPTRKCSLPKRLFSYNQTTKQKKPEKKNKKTKCITIPLHLAALLMQREEPKQEMVNASGAKKRKLGRRHCGNV